MDFVPGNLMMNLDMYVVTAMLATCIFAVACSMAMVNRKKAKECGQEHKIFFDQKKAHKNGKFCLKYDICNAFPLPVVMLVINMF